MVQTRGAIAREKQLQREQSTKDGPSGHIHETRSEIPMTKNELLEFVAENRPRKVESVAEIGCRSLKKTSITTNKSSFEARKKQLELEAAQAVANIEKDMIQKKLAADIAALEEECSVKSRNSVCESRASVSHKVERWLDNSLHEPEEPLRDVSTSQPQPGNQTVSLPPIKPAPASSDFKELAEALKEVATAAISGAPNTQMLSRLCTPKDLPPFGGDPMEWLNFKQAYQESTEVCRFSPKENLWRLRKCLRSPARDSVTALFVSGTTPDAVMATLELQYGNPDIILPRIVQEIKRLQPMSQDYHRDIVAFSVKVKNYVAAVKALGQEEYLRGMGITSIILAKLPPVVISKWSDYGFARINDDNKSRLVVLSDFLSEEALKISKTAICISSFSSARHDFRRKQGSDQTVMVQHGLDIYDNSEQSVLVQISGENGFGKCRYCRISKHLLPECKKFKKALRKDRWNFIKRNGLCYKCLVATHDKETCPAPVCAKDECGKSHHMLLHYKINSSLSQSGIQITQLPDPVPKVETIANVNNFTSKILLKIVSINIHGPKGIVNAIALLDDGSTVTLISASLADRIGIQGCKQTMRVCGAWENTELVCDTEIVQLGISNKKGEMFSIKARSVNELNLPIQHTIDISKYSHLAEIEVFLDGSIRPDILIGQDNFDLMFPMQVIRGKINEPYATLTPLGWCVHGCVSNLPQDNVYHYSLLVCNQVSDEERLLQEIQDDVRRSFSLESVGITGRPRLNSEDVKATAQLEEKAVLRNGRWYVGLPWKNDSCKMPDSFPNALKRLKTVERKMQLNDQFGERYAERVQHLMANDFARELSSLTEPSPRTWYLPHFGVDNPNKQKLRLVFDAAAKSRGMCLNDYLFKGPDLLISLYGTMLRFRENRYAITADIKDQFLRIKILEEDQDAFRFLWRDSPNDPAKTYVMTSLIFGANCSPFIAQFIKNKNAQRFVSSNPAAVHAICNQHYADDYIDSIDNKETVIQLVRDITHIHNEGGFEIRNWTSNCMEVLHSLPKEALGTAAVRFKTDQQDEGERTLGLIWYPKEDYLGFDVSLKKIPENIINGTKKPTKREVLRVIMSIFDVYGFLAPFTIKGKVMIQSTWKSEIQWDDVIPDDIHAKWINWIQMLKRISTIRLPRYYQNCSQANGKVNAQVLKVAAYTNLQLHVFCDASIQAMCAVAYWRWESNGIKTAFVSCKCRVAPLKHTSVPRLELQAALLAARLADTIGREHNMKAEKRYFWSDSSTVLHWIRNDARSYKPFVAHRLGEIDELTQATEWRYVPTKLNVADLATRETSEFSVFENEWFNGPAFLCNDKSHWPKDFLPEVNKCDLECILAVQIIKEDLPDIPDPTRFSSWLRLLKATCVVLSFVDKCKRLPGDVDGNMLVRAENLLIRYAQMQSFSEEISDLKNQGTVNKKSKLLTLTPLLDENKIMRAGGRIDATRDVHEDVKRPIILDGRHCITRLIARAYHIRAAHGNLESVVNNIKQKYWILRIRPTIKRVVMECMVCRIRKAQPSPPRMGDLPQARLAHHQRVFTFCGLDLFGPMEVAVGRRREKRYGVLFTCLTVRAIHIEIVPTLTTDSLIMALRRMAARRGWPLTLMSDNGRNLRGADVELRRSIEGLNQDSLKEAAVKYGTTWSFIPPASPHWGGAWERLIRTVKNSLKVVLKERAPRDEVLVTLMAEVEQIVNGRPLTHVSVEPGTDEALTPNHFLLGSSSNLPILGEFDDSDLWLKKRWRTAQRLADMFWSRWIKEFLPELIPRKKWVREVDPLKVGDLVLIVDPNAPRNLWLRGKVEATLPGKDNRVRVVDVRTRTGVLRRSAARVARIPVG